MNPTELNPDNLNPDLGAIADHQTVSLSPKPSQNLGTFLDRLYGTLFLPQTTFEQLKENPSFLQGLVVIALANILETLRLEQANLAKMIWAIISGVIGWIFFTFVLKQLAGVFQKQVTMIELLTLTGYASLPWLLMAPALSLPPQFRTPAAIAVIVWFIGWQIWSASIALSIKSWKTLTIIPLAIAGGVVALIWLSNTFKLILSITS
jgi:hypothetical protein